MIRWPTNDDLPQPVDLFGFPLRLITREQFVNTPIVRAQRHIRTRAHYLNSHTFTLSRDNEYFRQRFKTCDLLYADDMSVVGAGKWLGHDIPDRLSAADYSQSFFERCADQAVSLFMLGGAPITVFLSRTNRTWWSRESTKENPTFFWSEWAARAKRHGWQAPPTICKCSYVGQSVPCSTISPAPNRAHRTGCPNAGVNGFAGSCSGLLNAGAGIWWGIQDSHGQ